MEQAARHYEQLSNDDSPPLKLHPSRNPLEIVSICLALMLALAGAFSGVAITLNFLPQPGDAAAAQDCFVLAGLLFFNCTLSSFRSASVRCFCSLVIFLVLAAIPMRAEEMDEFGLHPWARWLAMAGVAFMFASQLLSWGRRTGRRPRRLAIVVAFALPVVFIFADWQVRIMLGLLPSVGWLEMPSNGNPSNLVQHQSTSYVVKSKSGLQVATTEHSIIVRNTTSQSTTMPAPYPPDYILGARSAISPDGQYFACGFGRQVNIYKIIAIPGTPPSITFYKSLLLQEVGDICALLLLSDDRTIAIGDRQAVTFRDFVEDAGIARIPIPGGTYCFALAASPDDRLIAGWSNQGIDIIDRKSNQIVRHFRDWNRHAPDNLWFSSDGNDVIANLWFCPWSYYCPVHRQIWLRCSPVLIGMLLAGYLRRTRVPSRK